MEWKPLADNITDSCHTVTSLPKGPGYVFRVGCVTNTGAGPFSDPSILAFMVVQHEGKASTSNKLGATRLRKCN